MFGWKLKYEPPRLHDDTVTSGEVEKVALVAYLFFLRSNRGGIFGLLFELLLF